MLPNWFLWLSLLFPRIALFCGWLESWSWPFSQPWAGISWLLLPRVLVLTLIYGVYGAGGWFWVHLVVMILVFLGGGGAANSRD